MDLLMLSGNSIRNRDWILQAQTELKDLIDNTLVQDYKHWEAGEEWIDLPYELNTLKASTPNGSYGVFAKSIGTVLAVQATAQNIITPKFLLLCGIPLGYIVKDYPQFGKDLAAIKAPIIIINNDHDPVGSAQDVQAYLSAFGSFNLITTKGDSHDYEDYPLLREQLLILRKGV